MSDCIFCKIIEKQLPSEIVFENDEMMAFKDINPAAPVHILLIPKKHIETLAHTTEVDEALLGKMMLQVPKIAHEHGLEHGFKTLVNTGVGGGQEVFHIHIHILGRPQA